MLDFCYSLSSLPSTFGSLHSLQRLSLSGCRRLILPMHMEQLSNLHYLGLDGCASKKKTPTQRPSMHMRMRMHLMIARYTMAAAAVAVAV